MRPHRWRPTRLPHPWDSPGKNTGVGCHLLPQCMKVKSESEVAQSCPTIATPWTAAHQAPPSMGFSRQEYWSGVPLPSPPSKVTRVNCHFLLQVIFLTLGSNLHLLHWQVDSLPLRHLGLLPSKLHQILVTSGGRKGGEKIRTLLPLQRTWLMRCVNYQWKDGPCTRRTWVTPLPTEEEQGIVYQVAEVFPT